MSDRASVRDLVIYNFIRLIGQQTQDYTSNIHQIHNKKEVHKNTNTHKITKN